jgi:hypothetical protein
MVLTAPGLMGEEVDAQVHRAGTTKDGAPWAAVEFVSMSDAQAARLRHVIDLELSAANAPAVLVVDGSIQKLQAAASHFATHSRRTHLANTSLQAINWLNEHGRRIALALVGDDVAGTTGEALLGFIAESFPKIHRARLDCPATAESLRLLLDRVEADSSEHKPWYLSDFASR